MTESAYPGATSLHSNTQLFDESGEGYLPLPAKTQEEIDAPHEYLSRFPIGTPIEPLAAPVVVNDGPYLVSSLSASMSDRVLTRVIRGVLQEAQLSQQSSPVVERHRRLPSEMFCVPCRKVLVFSWRTYESHLGAAAHKQNLEMYHEHKVNGRLGRLELCRVYRKPKDLGDPVQWHDPYVRWLS